MAIMLLIFFFFKKKTLENTYQSSFRFDERPVLAIHFIIETTGVTKVMAGAISPPQRG